MGRRYNRLNTDYLPLHALCRFFLESSGPIHEPGGKRMLPFLVDMARLFELFVAEWLQQHLPRTVRLSPQDIVRIGSTGSVEFRIDLTLHDADFGTPAVMDTKYKITDTPTSDDVAQIVASAVAPCVRIDGSSAGNRPRPIPERGRRRRGSVARPSSRVVTTIVGFNDD